VIAPAVIAASFWERNVMEPGKLPLLVCFASFVAVFLGTRTITRLIRAGRGPFHDIESSEGVHVHHAVPGLFLLLTGAFVALGASGSPWREVAGGLVGAGASLVLDEFALILHLQDVYWSDEGRASVQAVALVGAALALVLVGFTPFGVNDVDGAELGVRLGTGTVLVGMIVAVAICAVKGKYRLALLAVFLPPIAVVGAVRLARPGSLWDRRRHSADEHERAVARAARFDARWSPDLRRLGDLVAGRPSLPDPPAPAPAPPADQAAAVSRPTP
jgi:hypothetical protein